MRSRRKRSSLLSSEVPCGELTGATTSPTPQTVYITGSHINSQCRAIMNRYTDIALGRAGSRDLLLEDSFIAGGQIYCWRTDLLLGDSFIAGGQIYCWGTDLLLEDRFIAGGQIYCWRTDLFLGDRIIPGGQIYCRGTDLFLEDRFIAGGQIYCWGTDLLLGDWGTDILLGGNQPPSKKFGRSQCLLFGG